MSIFWDSDKVLLFITDELTGEMLSSPIRRHPRRSPSYWQMLEKYPVDPRIKRLKIFQFMLEGRWCPRSLFKVTQAPRRRSRWK